MVSGAATSLDGAKALQRRLKLHGAGVELENKKLRCLFDRTLKEICNRNNIKHFSPTIAGGQCVDLFKLFLVVRNNGGFSSVSGNGMWGLVAKQCGLDLDSGTSVKLMYGKYLDLFDKWLSKGAKTNSDAEVSGCLMDLEQELKGLLSEIFSDNWEKSRVCWNTNSKTLGLEKTDGKYPQTELTCKLDSKNYGSTHSITKVKGVIELHGSKDCVDVGGYLLSNAKNSLMTGDVGELQQKKREVVSDIILDGKLTTRQESSLLNIECVINSSEVSIPSNEDGISLPEGTTISDEEMLCNKDEMRVEEAMESDGSKKCDENKNLEVLDSAITEDISTCRRKPDSLRRMVHWVTELAKEPRYPEASSPFVKSIWKASGREHWKPFLLARKAMFLNQRISSSDQELMQINQRAHPFMFDDRAGSGYKRLGCRRRKLSRKMTTQAAARSELSGSTKKLSDKSIGGKDHSGEKSSQTSMDEDFMQLRVRLGENYQAVVPEWTGRVSESDAKWLGTRVWPQQVQRRNIVEKDPIGAGRQDTCNCEFQGSIECVRFHIAENRLKLKLELGSAFYLWKLDKMGEEVELSWTNKEVNKFKNIISLNRPSHGKCFWDEIVKGFRTKSWQDLVSYYYNVFLLRYRAYQNRGVPHDIDSDDDCEAWFGK